ncbi:hypothetical protein GCM10010300_83030 [Streptomyces olivaceoviridis]|uniref:hypothetical protein n=1 Tax=Streptomyces olivaceoviridis TaxID=1921 RepID=UPI001993A680|nr:hypothetical protein [Streptomyces olivaceoviridis]GGZ27117.1 hypothetical protein GCM10010300_83030 [Streptomyces olivaceoviridis]
MARASNTADKGTPTNGEAPDTAGKDSPTTSDAPDTAGALPAVGAASHTPEDAFFAAVDALVRTAPGAEAAGMLRRLAAQRQRTDAYRTRMRATPALFPVLDPLLTACLRPYGAAESGGGDARGWARSAPAAETPGRAAEINSGV